MSGTARGENWKNTGPHFLGETDYFIIGLWGWIQPPASLPSLEVRCGWGGAEHSNPPITWLVPLATSSDPLGAFQKSPHLHKIRCG